VNSNHDKLLIITNLYPSEWEPNRATFNKQQFDAIADNYEISFLIPVAFIDWFKNRKLIKQSDNKRYFPYFFTPKIGRRLYAFFMFFSMLIHSFLWVKKKQPNKILASWAYPDAVAACKLSRLLKCDFFFKVHGSDIDIQCQENSRASQVVKMSSYAKGVLSVSNALANKMVSLGIEKEKIKVVYNGVNHKTFIQETARPIKNKYVLFIGNLKFDKGVMELLEGFAKYYKSQPNLHLVYAGNGAMLSSLKSKVKELNIDKEVKFLGNISHAQVPQWLQHCELLALPSYHEGVPNVLLEAMACGVPIISTRVGGIPEVVNEKLCGKLVSIKNVEEITNALTYVLNKKWDKNLIQQHSQQFSWHKNKEQLIELLEVI